MNVKTSLWVGLAIILLGIGLLAGRGLNQREEKSLGAIYTFDTSTQSYLNGSSDVVGTHIGTSTVGVATSLVTSSVVSVISQGVSRAIYTIKVTSVASTTLNSLATSVQGSTDFQCDTTAPAASSTSLVTVDKINWFDAMGHLTNRVHNTSFIATNTASFVSGSNLSAGVGNELSFENLNFKCLRFNYSGVSTTIYVGLTTKI